MESPALRLRTLLRPFAVSQQGRADETLTTQASEVLACAEELLAAGSPSEQDRNLWCD